MARSLLIGNGVNRLNNPEVSWESVLKKLSDKFLRGAKLEYTKQKPFALLFEEICLSSAEPEKSSKDFAVKQTVADLVRGLNATDVHRRIMSTAVRHILTTNYDYSLELSMSESYPRKNVQRESKYSVFRRRQCGEGFVWHIHGEADAANTLTLGYDQYSGYLQKLRTYATAERAGESGSPFKRGETDFDCRETTPYSWLDVFFRDDVDIVGLGLDYTEIDLWWALIYKRKLKERGLATGKTVFHDWHMDPQDENARAKISLLEKFDVEVRQVQCESGFDSQYDKFLCDEFGV